MNKRSDIKRTVLPVLSVSLIAVSAAICLLGSYYRRVCFQMLGGFCESVIREQPEMRQVVLDVWKAQDFYDGTAENILTVYGYGPSKLGIADPILFWSAILGLGFGGILFLFSLRYGRRKSAARIQALTAYLERVNTGDQGLLFESADDEFSKLQDEIYKTVTNLYQTREDALTARNNFAENLSNIAHQLKTPITSISLSVQMAKEDLGDSHITEIERQIDRLLYLEEALLLLSRIDAGTLVLDKRPTDVFTILSLASDNLYELFAQKGVLIDVPEMGGIDINADLDWTMEAVMNLMKNCMEAAETDTTVHCAYEKNPLYVQIQIWDEGEGFEREDIPHLFQRFYRGRRSKGAGIGIGLALSKAIIEMQNGVIRAFNLPGGGACFEIRFYSH